jgi:hypothetical protein
VSNQAQQAVMTIPAFGSGQAMDLVLSATVTAEQRLLEARTVNPLTYTDLEHCFNESYRELKTNMSKVGYMITEAEKAIKKAKAEVLLDKYPEFMKDRPKSQDNADMREAFLTRDDTYMAAVDRLNMLKATEALFDGKIKVMENVCRYMRKQMDLVLRSGLSGSNLYNTNK